MLPAGFLAKLLSERPESAVDDAFVAALGEADAKFWRLVVSLLQDAVEAMRSTGPQEVDAAGEPRAVLGRMCRRRLSQLPTGGLSQVESGLSQELSQRLRQD